MSLKSNTAFQSVSEPVRAELPISIFASAFMPAMGNDVSVPTHQDVYDAMNNVATWISFVFYSAITNEEKQKLPVSDPLIRIACTIKDTPDDFEDAEIVASDILNLQKSYLQILKAAVVLLNTPPQKKNFLYTDDYGGYESTNFKDMSFGKIGDILAECYVNIAALPLFNAPVEDTAYGTDHTSGQHESIIPT